MGLRKPLLRVVEKGRRIYGSVLDMGISQLTIRTRTYENGNRSPDSTVTDVDLVLPPHYPIRDVSTSEIASSGGKYHVGDIVVGPITPSNGSDTGYTEAQLAPAPSDQGIDVQYIVTGAYAGTYRRVALQSPDPFSHELVLTRVR